MSDVVVGQNVSMSVQGSILTVKIDLSKDFGPSASGKTVSIASTKGNVGVPGNEGIKVGINVYKYPEKKPA